MKLPRLQTGTIADFCITLLFALLIAAAAILGVAVLLFLTVVAVVVYALSIPLLIVYLMCGGQLDIGSAVRSIRRYGGSERRDSN